MRQYELIERVKAYDPLANEDMLNRAYVFAMKMHAAQTRESGDPYFSHPLEVAEILTHYHLDAETVIAALLHDTVEDTPTSYDDIKELFSPQIADLVEGVTKLSKVQLKSNDSKQAQNFQKLILAINKDIRVLLIKLGDRLHNIRTLHFCENPEKQRRIATETMEIYAPLAERIGMHAFKTELQDACFKILHPDAFASIDKKLSYLRENGQKDVHTIINQLQEDLQGTTLTPLITTREKHPYSIWRKMQRQNITFDQLFDILAFRIVVDTVADCYHVLGLIHTHYHMIPGRYKDYISTPKPNGYQSLHSTVIGPLGRRVEVQIRTKKMHETADYGVAAHWAYKQGSNQDSEKYRWLRDLIEMLQTSQNPNEFLENTKITLYNDQVFAFSPKGDIICLPSGATALDFAYAVHSTVGNTCIGVKINDKIKSLRTVIKNGDQIHILTNKNQKPSPDWENITITMKAKAAIRRELRLIQFDKNIEQAKEQLLDMAKEHNLTFTDKDLAPLIENYTKLLPANKHDVPNLLAIIGAGLISYKEVFYALYPQTKSTIKKALSLFKKENKEQKQPKKATPTTQLIEGIENGMAYSFAKCCNPVRGDDIVGIINTGKDITIHTQTCKTLNQYQDEPGRWVPVFWRKSLQQEQKRIAKIKVVLENAPEAFGTLMHAIAAQNIMVSSLKTKNATKKSTEIHLSINVAHKGQIESLITHLSTKDSIITVHRLSV